MQQTPESSRTPVAEESSTTNEGTTASNIASSIDEVIALTMSGQPSKLWTASLNSLSKEQLLKYTANGLDPLTVLNPNSCSLVYLYFITARCLDATPNNGLQMFQLLNHFIQVFDVQQIQLAPEKFTLVGQALLHLTDVLKKPLLPLEAFKTAITRITGNCSTLTSLHAPFIQTCISAKTYRYPLELLDQDIETIDPSKHNIDIQDFLLYYYYGSVIYIGNKKYDRALEFLSIVISAPTQKAISAIQIAAYKKFVLVSLISQGQLHPLPKYTAQAVEKICRTQAIPYVNLVKAFDETDIQMFQDTVNKSSGLYQADNHMGLIKQCFQALYRQKIKELTKVYITVGLNEMTSKIGDITPQQLELILIEMINQNQILASLSVTEDHVKMVHFIDGEETTQPDLEERIFNIAAMNDRVAMMDRLEGLNRDFQTKYITLSANGGQLAAAPYDEDFDIPLDDDNKMFS